VTAIRLPSTYPNPGKNREGKEIQHMMEPILLIDLVLVRFRFLALGRILTSLPLSYLGAVQKTTLASAEN
jgi:hypothetical protein